MNLQVNDKGVQLYSSLRDRGLTGLTQDEFFTAFSNPDKNKRLYGTLKKTGLIKSLSEEDFRNTFFSPSKTQKGGDTKPDASQESPPTFVLEAGNPTISLYNAIKGAFEEGVIQEMGTSMARGVGVGSANLIQGLGQLSAFAQKDPVARSRLNEVSRNVGEKMRDYSMEVFEGNEKFANNYVTTAVPEAIGGMLPLVATGVVAAPLSFLSGAVSLAASEYEQAYEKTGDEQIAFKAYLAGLPIGALDAIPIGRVLSRSNKLSGGLVARNLRSLAKKMPNTAAGAEVVLGATEEALQEGVSQVLINASAKEIYDKHRTLTEGIIEGAEIGFGAGFVLNALGVSYRRARTQTTSRSKKKELDKAIKDLDRETIRQIALLPEAKRDKGKGKIPREKALSQNTVETLPLIEPLREIPGVNEDLELAGKTGRARLHRFMRQYFSSRGLLPTAVFEMSKKKENGLAAEINMASSLGKQLLRQIDEVSGVTFAGKARRLVGLESGQVVNTEVEFNGQSMNLMTLVNMALRENITDSQKPRRLSQQAGVDNQPAFNALPDELKPTVMKMRDHVDRLQRSLRDVGAVDQNYYAQVILPSMGVYLNRSYAIFNDPKWKDNIPVNIRNNAVKYILDNNSNMTRKQAELHVTRMINATNKDLGHLMASGKLGHKDLNIFTRRKDIAEPIRKLFGEYKDPIINYVTTISKISNVVENHKFLSEVREFGLGTYFFKEGDVRAPMEATVKISEESTSSMSPLNGLYTTQEIYDAFSEAFSDKKRSTFMRYYMTANGLVKYGKTVGAIGVHPRNILGGSMVVAANGFNPANTTYTNKALKVAFNREGHVDEAYRLTRLGVFDENPIAGEVLEMFDNLEVRGDDFLPSYMSRRDRLLRQAKKGGKFLADVYQAEDNMLRASYFYQVREQYGKALKGKRTDAEIDEISAKIVRDTYMTYTMVPKVVDYLKKLPLVGTFPSFSAEMIRVTKNTVQLARQEMAVPELRKIGLRRITSLMSVSMSPFALTAVMRMLMGVDQEEDKELRRFMPPWSENSPILYLDKDENGNRKYIDMGYLDPWAVMRDPVMSIFKGDDDRTVTEKTIRSVTALLEPFVAQEILAGKIGEIWANKKSSGGNVFNPQSSSGDKFSDIVMHLWEAFEPGTITQMRRVSKAYNGVISEYGRKFSMFDEMVALTGSRTSTLNIPTSLSFKAFRANKDKQDSKRIYNKLLYSRGRVTSSDLSAAYEKANEAYLRVMYDLQKDVRSAYKAGVSEGEIRALLQQGGWTKREVRELLYGFIQPMDRKDRYSVLKERGEVE